MKQLLALVWLLAVTSAFGQDATTENAARIALAQGEYRKVLDLYQPSLAAGKALPDIARYRLAIASSRLSQPIDAWNHLRSALEQNPQGTFATSAARLEELRTAILAACEKRGAPGCDQTVPTAASPASAASAASAVLEVVPDAMAPQPAADAASPTAGSVSPSAAATDSPKGGSSNTELAASESSEPKATGASAIWVAVLAIQATMLTLVGWIAWRIYRRDRRLPAGVDGVESLRDDVAALLHRLTLFGGSGTELYHHLRALLPLLEREAGRSLYRSTGKAHRLASGDRASVDLARSLTSAPLDVLTASAQEVQNVFQRPAI